MAFPSCKLKDYGETSHHPLDNNQNTNLANNEIDIYRVLDLKAFRVEVDRLREELLAIELDSDNISILKNINYALIFLDECADDYSQNVVTLDEFRTEASIYYTQLHAAITPFIRKPSVYLEKLEQTIIEAPQDPGRRKKLAALQTEILIMNAKAHKLMHEGHCNAAREATVLCTNLSNYAYQYGTHRMNNFDFSDLSKKAIKTAHIELDKHRGWKRFLQNLTLAVLTVGIGYGIAALYKGSFFVFDPDTESKEKVDALEIEIARIK